MPPGFKGSKFSFSFPEISDLLVGRGYSELGIDGVRQKCFGSLGTLVSLVVFLRGNFEFCA